MSRFSRIPSQEALNDESALRTLRTAWQRQNKVDTILGLVSISLWFAACFALGGAFAALMGV